MFETLCVKPARNERVRIEKNGSMSPRVTLADVAKRAAVSPTAASLILNGREGTRLSADAKQRVLDAAAELGYRPNLMARGLRMEKSATVGFVSDRIASTRYAGPMIRGALRMARELGHTMFVTETEGDIDEQQRAIDALLDRQVDALVVATVTGQLNLPTRTLPVRLVLLNGTISPTEHIAVLPDEAGGGAAAARHLIELGHTRVHILGTSNPEHWTIPVARRITSLMSEFESSGVEVIPVSLDRPIWDADSGIETMTRALEDHGPVRAVVALNDSMAAGAYHALSEAGLRIPHDVSVVSFDDDEIVSFLRPELTTVALPFEAMGRRAIELALSPEPVAAGEYLESMTLQHRHSTARLAG